MFQGVLLPDGPSDMPLSNLLEQLCLNFGARVAVQPVDPRSLQSHTVEGRLGFLEDADIRADVVFVHRDAEREPPERRRAEILRASGARSLGHALVPVVPVRMTEAWLLLDEAQIRAVAGKPRGRVPLHLPSLRNVEDLPDPKECLMRALEAASEASGRRLDRVRDSFGRHRRLLLERLDIVGPVTQLSAWQQLEDDVRTAIRRFEST